MVTLSSLLKKFQEAMTAAAFAEEGEFVTARQILESSKPSKNAHKKVLLGMDDTDVDMNLIRYAVNLCQRIGAKLEILHVLRPGELTQVGKENSAINEDFLAPLQQDMEKRGIVYQPVFAESYLAEELANYVEKRRDILCVILDTEKLEEKQCQAEKAETKQCTTIRQKIEKELQKLKCPVVVYGRPLRV